MTSLSHAIAGRTARGGHLRPDRIVLSGARGPAIVERLREAEAVPADPSSVIICLDFHAPDVESRIPRARARSREYAARAGIPHLHDLNAGIGSQVIVEWGLVRPGDLVLGCGRCLGLVGGVGVLGVRLDEMVLAEVVRSGECRWELPEVVTVTLAGRAPRYLGAFDLARAVADALGDRLPGRVVEIGGDREHLPVDTRCALSGLLVEMGAAAALVRPDARVTEYLEERGIEPAHALPDGDGAGGTGIDVEGILPRVASAYDDPGTPLEEVAGTEVHGAFLGSCYAGHLGDLATAAEILRKGKRVAPGVRLVLSPASLDVARAALNAGYYDVFLQSGAMVTAPGAGAGSIGGGAVLGEGETMVSTSEYHHPLGPGQEPPRVLLASTATAAAAAVAGSLVDPGDFIT